MTAARGTRDGHDAEDLDVEEALALVREDGARTHAAGLARANGAAHPADSRAPDDPTHDGPPIHDNPIHDNPVHDNPVHGTPVHGNAAHDDSAHDNPAHDNPGPTPPHGDTAAAGKHEHHTATPWPEARAVAARAARSVPGREPVSVRLGNAFGLALAAPLIALTDLPSFDTSAMDGWAVAGPGPWAVRGAGALAGHAEPEPLGDGEAVPIATGARVPRDATAVLRTEHGRTDDMGRLHALREVVPGQDIRPRAQECRRGERLVSAGSTVTPAVLGLAAAAGYDTVSAVVRPRVEVLVLGDELLTEGLPHEGLIRDALGPMLPSWLEALGAEVAEMRRLGDDASALYGAVTSSDADLIVTTGGTAAGPVDHVHPTLRRIGAELLVHGVKVRPGHPMLLARTRENQHLVGLPGNPLAAVSGLFTLVEPLLRVLAGRVSPQPYELPVAESVQGHPLDTRLIPVTVRAGRAVPLHFNGPAMLRGIAAADALAVVPPGGTRPGQELELLPLPWALAGIGVGRA